MSKVQDATNNAGSAIGADTPTEGYTSGTAAVSAIRGLRDATVKLHGFRGADAAAVYRLMRAGKLDRVVTSMARLVATPNNVAGSDPVKPDDSLPIPSILDAVFNAGQGSRRAVIDLANRIVG